MTIQPLPPYQREGRTVIELGNAGPDADALVETLRRVSRTRRVEAAALLSVGWSRRHLLDVTLELARRQAGIRRSPANDGYRDRQRRANEARKERREVTRAAEDARWPDETELRTWARMYRRDGDRSARALEAERVWRRRLRTARQNAARVIITNVGAPDAER